MGQATYVCDGETKTIAVSVHACVRHSVYTMNADVCVQDELITRGPSQFVVAQLER